MIATSRRSRASALVTLGLVLAVSACSSGGDEPDVVAVTAPAVVQAAKQAPPTPVVPPRWPLTGVSAADVAERPALAIKIENPENVRPQTGIDQSDMVWEEVVEGGVTRFVAVFHSQVPDDVGPIRSVRPMDPAIASPLHGLIAFSGGQARFVSALSASGLQLLSNDAGDDGFYRSSDRAAPHNVHGTPATFWAQANPDHQASPPAQFAFARSLAQATAVTAGTPASSVQVTMSGYSRPGWDWDAASGTWLRSESGIPASARSGTRLSAANVVVLRVDLVNSGTVDPAGSPVPETKLVGSGEALVATGGKTIAATWSKSATDAVLTLTTADGTNVLLAPGQTWIELAPTGSGAVSTQ